MSGQSLGVLFLGVAFLAIGLAGEALSGTWFEGFFDPRYPHDATRWDDEAIKTRFGRLFFWTGLVLTIVGAAAEFG